MSRTDCTNCVLTRHGVCYDLTNSPFYSGWRCFRFYFSSLNHKESFDSKLPVRIPWLNDSLSRRFKMNLDVAPVAVFQLYNQVETRGFFVELTDESYSLGGDTVWRSAEQVVFDGLLVRWKDSSAREETTIAE